MPYMFRNKSCNLPAIFYPTVKMLSKQFVYINALLVPSFSLAL